MFHHKGLALALFAFLAAGAAGQPVVIVVQDGAGNTPDIAPGSIFVVKGTGLSAPGFVQVSALPLQTTLNNVSISATPATGGAALQALMIYTYNVDGVNQLAALLPSSVAPGEYDLRVTNQAQPSAPQRIRVLERKLGIVSADSTGSGQAQATTEPLALIRFATGELAGWQLRPVRAGDAVVLWGTGLGSDPASDVNGGSSGDRTATAQVRVIVGGVEVTPFYAGRSSGLPGTDQINFFLPASIEPNCAVPVQVRAGGVLSNLVTIAVAAPGAATCPATQFTADELQRLSQGQEVFMGLFNLASSLTESHVPTLPFPAQYSESLIGSIGRIGANQIAMEGMSLRPGQCISWRRLSGFLDFEFGSASFDGLDAGPSIRVTGAATLEAPKNPLRVNVYIGSAVPGPTRVIGPGNYRLEAPGGAEIGPFSADLAMPSFDWTNRAAITSINRNAGLTVNWTGGAAGGVNITGFGARVVSGNLLTDFENVLIDAVLFSCIADASAGSFTVPVSILSQLPAVGGNDPIPGSLGVFAFPGDLGVRFNSTHR